jgi:hypothetical protein
MNSHVLKCTQRRRLLSLIKTERKRKIALLKEQKGNSELVIAMVQQQTYLRIKKDSNLKENVL